MGLSNLADGRSKVLNRAAENAVKTATPIFLDAIKKITCIDGTNILLGDKNADTCYLQSKMTQNLYESFKLVSAESFPKVGADKVWSN